MFKALFEHNKASHSPVSVLKGMNGFKADMKIKNIVKDNMFLCIVVDFWTPCLSLKTPCVFTKSWVFTKFPGTTKIRWFLLFVFSAIQIFKAGKPFDSGQLCQILAADIQRCDILNNSKILRSELYHAVFFLFPIHCHRLEF